MSILTIITINLNNKEGLERTIKSILDQSFSDFEYIIIDGGSTDGSKDVISSISDKLAYWVSEPDNGIYQAMNKGIRNAKGDYLLFLNSGDYLSDENIIKNMFSYNPTEDIVYGDMFFNKRKYCYPDHLDLNFFVSRSLGHGATLIKKELFINYGYYNESLKIVSDWEFFLTTIILKSCSYKHIKNLAVTNFNTDGISSDPKFSNKLHAERVSVFKRLLPELVNRETENSIIAETMLKIYAYENSKLVPLVMKFEKSFLFKLLKKIYRSI